MYKVSQSVFINGSIIEAKHFIDEFGAVARGITAVETNLNLSIDELQKTSKQYTDKKISTLIIDGGAF